jgi:hypothetical protein
MLQYLPPRLFWLLSAMLTFLGASPAQAFEYLEHSYFADRSCLVAQERLAERISRGDADPGTINRYMALALVCPNTWERAYCTNGRKQAAANINRLPKSLAAKGGASITLGDFAALPDHISSFGPVQNFPPSAARRQGLLQKIFTWIAVKPSEAGGVIGTVQEGACANANGVPWDIVEEDIHTYLMRQEELDQPAALPPTMLSPFVRAPIPRGVRDPATAYSLNNPHFLDLVLRDGHHFSEHAYSSWLGYHTTGVDIAGRSCEAVIGLDAGTLRGFAAGVPYFDRLDWHGMIDSERVVLGCALLGEHLRRRLLEWGELGDPRLTGPVRNRLQRYEALSGGSWELHQIAVALMGLVFEGSSLHFIQDGLAAGHMRPVHNRRAISDRRYDHDHDNREGVVALLRTAGGEQPFIAFGDSYLLGPPLADRFACDWDAFKLNTPGPQTVANCLLQHQRGIVVAAGAASLLDWALGGTLFVDAHPEINPCITDDMDQAFICRNLPLQAPSVPGQRPNAQEIPRARLQHGVLPVPPPAYHYESLSINASMDLAGTGNQVGLDVAFYSELGDWASWLTSYRVGIRAADGDGSAKQFTTDFSYGFHYRYSARFLFDAEPFVYAGIQGVRPDRAFFLGLGPRVGVTALPEGWTKIPLELSLSYRVPVTLLTSEHGFFGRSIAVEAHWLQFSLGLAFM